MKIIREIQWLQPQRNPVKNVTILGATNMYFRLDSQPVVDSSGLRILQIKVGYRRLLKGPFNQWR